MSGKIRQIASRGVSSSNEHTQSTHSSAATGASGVDASLQIAAAFALGLTKKAIAAAAHNTLAQQLDLERDYQKLAGASPDAREGVASFLEKRPARFTGRKA